jgi:hypothetical protein
MLQKVLRLEVAAPTIIYVELKLRPPNLPVAPVPRQSGDRRSRGRRITKAMTCVDDLYQ